MKHCNHSNHQYERQPTDGLLPEEDQVQQQVRLFPARRLPQSSLRKQDNDQLGCDQPEVLRLRRQGQEHRISTLPPKQVDLDGASSIASTLTTSTTYDISLHAPYHGPVSSVTARRRYDGNTNRSFSMRGSNSNSPRPPSSSLFLPPQVAHKLHLGGIVFL